MLKLAEILSELSRIMMETIALLAIANNKNPIWITSYLFCPYHNTIRQNCNKKRAVTDRPLCRCIQHILDENSITSRRVVHQPRLAFCASGGGFIFIQNSGVCIIADSVKLTHTVDGIHGMIGVYPDIRIITVALLRIAGVDT